MSTLVIDENEANCRAIVHLLQDLGLSSFRSCSPLEASHLYLDHLGTLRMIICDMDSENVGQFKNTMRANPAPGILPIVATSSNPWRLRGRTAGTLSKPFGKEQLRQALIRAWKNETSRRSSILWIGTDETHADFQMASPLLSSSKTLFRNLIAVEKATSWKQVIQLQSSKVGAVFIHPALLSDADTKLHSVLHSFRSSPVGLVLPWICLSRKPEHVRALREIAGTFIDLDENFRWPDLLSHVSNELSQFWEGRRLAQNIRSQGKEAKQKSRIRNAGELTALLPWNATANSVAGEAILQAGDSSRGKQLLWRAIQINPGLTQPYLHLLRVADDPLEKSRLIETATTFCPGVLKRRPSETEAP